MTFLELASRDIKPICPYRNQSLEGLTFLLFIEKSNLDYHCYNLTSLAILV
jgi:hypothetical protein